MINGIMIIQVILCCLFWDSAPNFSELLVSWTTIVVHWRNDEGVGAIDKVNSVTIFLDDEGGSIHQITWNALE